jgi:predicted transcriptional regulator
VQNEHYAFILVSDEKYWTRLCERHRAGKETHAFMRKNQVAPKETQKLLFYIKKPVMQVRGSADFLERSVGDYKEQWIKHGGETCFESFDEYHEFIQGREKVTCVRFKNLTVVEQPKLPEVTASILGSMRWFRGRYVTAETAQQLTQ